MAEVVGFSLQITGVDQQVQLLNNVEKELKQVSASRKILTDLEKSGVKLRGEAANELKTLTKREQELKIERQKTTNAVKNLIKEEKFQKGSIEQLSASLNTNIERYRRLSAEQRNNDSIGGKLKKTIQSQDEEVKRLNASTGRAQGNVGNYGSALKGLGTKLLGMAAALGIATGAVQVFKNIISSTQSIGDAFVITMAGASEAGNYFARSLSNMDFTDLLTGLREAYEDGKRYATALDEIGDRQIALGLQKKDIEYQISLNRIIAKDRGRDLKEREKAIDEIVRLEELKVTRTKEEADIALQNDLELASKRSGIQKDELKNLLVNYNLYTDDLAKAAAKESELREAAIITKQTLVGDQYIRSREFNQQKYNELLAQESEATQKNIKLAQGYNQIDDELRNKLKETIGGVIDADKEYATGQEALILLKNRLITELIKEEKQDENVKEVLADIVELNEALRIGAENGFIDANKSIDDYITKLQEAADKTKAAWDEAFSNEEEDIPNDPSTDYAILKLQETEEYKRQLLEENRAQGLIGEQEYQDEIAAIDKQTTNKKLENAQAYMQAASNLTNILSDNYEKAKQRELSAAGDNEVKRAEIEEKYRKKQQKVAIAQALINGAMAVTNIIANTPGSVLNPAAWIGIALAGVTTAIEVATIAKQKFAKGGILKGATHAQGGIEIAPGIEAENNEIVLTKGVYENPFLREQASALNVAGGGRSLTASNYMASGGVVANPSVGGLNVQEIVRLTTQSIASIPVVVYENDITTMQRRVTVNENQFIL